MDAFKKVELGLLAAVFLLGVVFYISLANSGTISGFFAFNDESKASSNFIEEDSIEAYSDRVVIHIDDPIITRYTDSGSMEPFLSKTANGVEIKPQHEEDVKVGDVITFDKDGLLIVHRVVEIDKDEQGVYFITKGDNNNVKDEKVRFSQIKSILVAVIY